jgi:hypothetical protein
MRVKALVPWAADHGGGPRPAAHNLVGLAIAGYLRSYHRNDGGPDTPDGEGP